MRHHSADQRTRFPHVLAILACVLAVVRGLDGTILGDDIPSQDGLRLRLLSYDSTFLDGIRVTGKFSSSASTMNDKQIEFTADLVRSALRETRQPPSYLQESDPIGGFAERSYDADGNVTLISEDRVVHIFEPAKSARMNVFVEYLITPEGAVKRQSDKFQRVVMYPPDDITLLIPKVRVLWTLGRGFASYLDEITQIELVENGLLKVTAVGRTMGGPATGQWTLMIDPSQADLVRSAKWSPPGDSKPCLEINTVGTLTSGTLPHPENGTFSLDVGGFPVIYSVSFSAVERKFDDDLYGDVESKFSGDFPPNTNVHDRRTTPETYHFVNPQGKTRRSKPEPLPEPRAVNTRSRFQYMMWGNLTILLLFGAIYFARKRATK